MTIYIDVVLIENLIMNYIILLATGIVLKINIKHTRLIMASFIGAIYSIIVYISKIEIYSNFVLKIILSLIMVYVAYNPQKFSNLWKYLLIFYLTSFVFGGAAFSLIYIIKPQEILMKNGLFKGTYTIKVIILGSVISFVIIILAFKLVKNKFSKRDMYCEIEIGIEGKKVKTNALVDTGNFLKEPITNMPVVVTKSTLLYEVLPKELLNNIENILGGDLNKISEEIKNRYAKKLKLIPFTSLGKQNGMLIGIKADYVSVFKGEEEKENKFQNIIIGIYPKSLTKKAEYRALIGIELI